MRMRIIMGVFAGCCIWTAISLYAAMMPMRKDRGDSFGAFAILAMMLTCGACVALIFGGAA